MTCHCFAAVLDVSILWEGRNKTLWSTQYCGSQGSSVSTVTILRARGQMHCGTLPVRSKSSILQNTMLSLKAPSASYTVSIRGSFSGGKRSGCEPIHSPPSGDVRSEWSLTSTLGTFWFCTEGKLYVYTIARYFTPNFIVLLMRGLYFLFLCKNTDMTHKEPSGHNAYIKLPEQPKTALTRSENHS